MMMMMMMLIPTIIIKLKEITCTPPYFFMAQCLNKQAQEQLYLFFYLRAHLNSQRPVTESVQLQTTTAVSQTQGQNKQTISIEYLIR
jgi:hypothetical protein